MTKGNRKAQDRRILRKKLNRSYHGFQTLSKMIGRYARYNYGGGI